MSTELGGTKIIIPKTPKPKITKIPKNISYINLIEADDDSDSSLNGKMSTFMENKEKRNDKGYLSDHKYKDSFDEDFGNESETNPDSGKAKL